MQLIWALSCLTWLLSIKVNKSSWAGIGNGSVFFQVVRNSCKGTRWVSCNCLFEILHKNIIVRFGRNCNLLPHNKNSNKMRKIYKLQQLTGWFYFNTRTFRKMIGVPHTRISYWQCNRLHQRPLPISSWLSKLLPSIPSRNETKTRFLFLNHSILNRK